MRTISDPGELQRRCLAWKGRGARLGLVPTMGAFHQGHLALMDRARGLCDKLVVSLFVNPAQFGENEDLAAYPRDFEADRARAESVGADLLFAPEPAAMYPPDHATWIDVPDLGRRLCGASRPGHFRGVCTVVAKLFMLIQPEAAVFGQKDWQQLAIIRRMVRDLNIPVRVVGHETVRDPDGLALSSRNAYLTATERAAAIRQGLLRLARAAEAGQRDAAELTRQLVQDLARDLPAARLDYAEIVDPEDLTPLTRLEGMGLAAVALFLGRARLIDNILLQPGG